MGDLEGKHSQAQDSADDLGLSADRKTLLLFLLLLGKGPGGLSALCKAVEQVRVAWGPALPFPPREGPRLSAHLVCGSLHVCLSARLPCWLPTESSRPWAQGPSLQGAHVGCWHRMSWDRHVTTCQGTAAGCGRLAWEGTWTGVTGRWRLK